MCDFGFGVAVPISFMHRSAAKKNSLFVRPPPSRSSHPRKEEVGKKGV